MKKIHFTLVITTILFSLNVLAQTESVEVIVKESLEQLPSEDAQSYCNVMERLASTGEKGIVEIAGQMMPADKGENAQFEYAINGVVDYTLRKGNEKYRAGIIEGLVKALNGCSDNPHKAFLMSELQKCATPKKFGVFCKYLSDPYLQDFAISGIAKLQGADKKVLKLIKSEKAPREKLAYLAYFKQLKKAEKTLLNWLPTADERTKASIYMALTTCGSAKSMKVLEEAAKNVDFKIDATSATDAYLRLKEKLGQE